MQLDEALLLTVHLAATVAMVGLIWFVQVVHYPLFARVGEDGFVEYEQQHQTRTSFVVGPFMAVEGFSALAIAAWPPAGVGRLLPLAGLALLGVIHLSTVTLQVPAHGALGEAHDARTIRRLVATNWIRTIGWSARGVLAAAILIIAVT